MWELVIWPDRAQYRPGVAIGLAASVRGPAGATGTVKARVTERAAVVGALEREFELDGQGRTHLAIAWEPPLRSGWRAFGADAHVEVHGETVAFATTAFDVAPHWGSAPRYGFLSDFRTGGGAEADQTGLDMMLRLHLNCVQFYDWMYTHYDYRPPEDLFTDVLGRTVHFGAVRRRIELCRARGMAPIAYASVYGAEKPFAEAHPDWLLYDGAGRPMSLAGLFYIQDPSPGCGWRQYLLNSYRDALEMGFAGLHCDTYGSPKAGLTHDGRLVRLEQVLPGLLADAHALAEEIDPAEGGAMLNNVKAWPVEAMAQAPGAAIYIEVWDPDETYRDLYELILRVRHLDRSRQPILAAYLSAFFPGGERPPGAMCGLRLASAAIFASGGFHLLPGEGNGVLAHAYYPDHGKLDPDDWEVLRAYWDFQTRYGPLLADPGALDVSAANTGPDASEARFTAADGVLFSAKAMPGTVWTILKEGSDYRTVHLINLTSVTVPRWNSAQPEAQTRSGVHVRLETLRPPRSVWWASPDVDGGRPQSIAWRLEFDDRVGQVLVAELPSLHYWSMMVIEDA